jgi:hypothetical protein
MPAQSVLGVREDPTAHRVVVEPLVQQPRQRIPVARPGPADRHTHLPARPSSASNGPREPFTRLIHPIDSCDRLARIVQLIMCVKAVAA